MIGSPPIQVSSSLLENVSWKSDLQMCDPRSSGQFLSKLTMHEEQKASFEIQMIQINILFTTTVGKKEVWE